MPALRHSHTLTAARAVALACALALAGCAGSEKTSSSATTDDRGTELTRAELGPVLLTVRADPPNPTLTDLIELVIDIDSAEGVKVTLPRFDRVNAALLGPPPAPPASATDGTGGDAKASVRKPAVWEQCFLVRDYHEDAPALMKDGRWRHRVRYSLEPARSGKFDIAPISISFDDQREENVDSRGEHRLATEVFTLEVQSVELGSAPSPADLSAPAAARALPAPPWPTGILASVIAALALLAGGIVYLMRRTLAPPPPAPPIPPRLLARAELDQLLRKNLVSHGLIQEFYYELTAIVRRYMERAHGLHAPEQTTEEFLQELASSQSLDPTLTVSLKRFLESADLVKYAAQIPTLDIVESSVLAARAIIDHEAAAQEAQQ